MIKLDYPMAGRIYALSLIIGLAVLALSAYLGYQQISVFRTKAEVVYEKSILTSLQLDSLNQELLALNNAVEQSLPRNATDESASSDKPEEEAGLPESEVAHIMLDIANLQAEIEDKSEQLVLVTQAKNTLFNEMAITILVVLFALPIGLVLTVLGILGMRYRIKIFEDRRGASRESD